MYILSISDANADNLKLSGGKGASLSHLSRLPVANVPDGFIITTGFFSNYILPAVNQLKDGADVKRAVAGIALPMEAQEMIREAYVKLVDETPVAVRSSATAEDLPDASFAGQQDSYLNVTGADAVIKATLDCFASLYNERAVSYRAKNKFDENQIQMAVVVQRMVNASAAGVMFTADPMTSDRLTVAIEAVEGLGEELVSGRKIPATYNIKGDIIKKKSKDDVLTEAQIRVLVKIGKEIEREYGCPQDIEWALEGDTFHIVQSRPITTLFPCPPSPDGFKRCYCSIGHMQVMTDTILPLGMSFWGRMSPDVTIVAAGGRLYMEVTHNLPSKTGMALVRQKMSNSDELMDDALLKVWARKEYVKTILKGRGSQFAIPKTIVPAMLAGWKAYRKNDPAIIDAYERRMEQSIGEVQKKLSALSGREVVEFIIGDMKELMKDLMDPEGFGPLLVSFYQTKSIDKAGRELLGQDNISSSVSKWLRVNITSEMGVAVSHIADAARAFPEVVNYLETAGDAFNLDDLRKLQGGEMAAKEFEIFFTKYGMRCPGEIDITKPRFVEAPSKILSSVLAEIKLPEGYAMKKFEQGKRESDAAVEALVLAAKEKWGDAKAKKLDKQLSFYRNFTGLRESPKYFWMKRYWVYKQAILSEAEALVHTGKLRRADDVFYLGLDELLDLYDGNFVPDYAKIDGLRSDYEKWGVLTPPRLIFSDGEVVQGEYKRDIPEGALAGLAVSSGIVEGRARVILDIKDANKIEKGDILVTKFTDPSWTPAFMSIGGLVTEIGGIATHGAVVTREYGMPAVVGVVNATQAIPDGASIRLNGDEGYVEVLER